MNKVKNISVYGYIIIILCISFLCRFIFQLLNWNFFSGSSFSEILNSYIVGLKFDLATWSILLLPSSLFLGFYFIKPAKIFKTIFYFFNVFSITLFIVLNCIDFKYFSFVYRRTSIQDIFLIKDSLGMIKKEIIFEIIFLAVIAIFILLFSKIKIKQLNQPISKQSKYITVFALIFFHYFSLFGFSNCVIVPTDAAVMVKPILRPLALNTPFQLLHSGFQYFKNGNVELIKERNYFPQSLVNEKFPLKKSYANNVNFTKPNIVIFLLESFSFSFLDPNNKDKPNTPFLDSIRNNGLYFSNAYASSTTSSQSLSVLSSGIPSLMYHPFFGTQYSNTINYESIGYLLKKEGYHNSFFFGGSYDHFGFKKGLNSMGIDNYYCEKDFNDHSQHDGIWGIYDGPFLQFFANQTKIFPKPFFSIFFNLSSHYPFKIPENEMAKFSNGNKIEAHRGVRYVDEKLKLFFDSIKNESWYQNTIFVFLADHVSKEQNEEKYNKLTKYKIPIIIYKSDGSLKGENRQLISHVDIAPTILNLIGYNKSFYSFGNSAFDSTIKNRFVMQTEDYGVYHFIDDSVFVEFDENNNKISSIFKYPNDKVLKNNVAETYTQKLHYDSLIRMYLQNFSYSILNNKLKD